MEHEAIQELERALRESQDLTKRLEEKLNEAIQARRNTDIQRIVTVMDETGIKLDELARHLGFEVVNKDAVSKELNSVQPKRSSKLPSKYRDPMDPSVTWAGRGGEPKWIRPYQSVQGRKGLYSVEVLNPEHPKFESFKKKVAKTS